MKREIKKTTDWSSFLCLSWFKLLNFNLCASCFEVSLELFSIFLRNAFLNSLRSSLNEVLCVLKTKTSNLTYNLDNVELGSASVGKDYVELGLLFSCGSCCAANCCNCNGSCGYAELLFECAYEVLEFKDCESLYLFKNVCDLFGSLFYYPPIKIKNFLI